MWVGYSFPNTSEAPTWACAPCQGLCSSCRGPAWRRRPIDEIRTYFESLFCARHCGSCDSGYTGDKGRWWWGMSLPGWGGGGTPIFAACFRSVPRAVSTLFLTSEYRGEREERPRSSAGGQVPPPPCHPELSLPFRVLTARSPAQYAPSPPGRPAAPVLRSARPSERVLPTLSFRWLPTSPPLF